MRTLPWIAALLLAGCSGASDEPTAGNGAATASGAAEAPPAPEPDNGSAAADGLAPAQAGIPDDMRWNFARSARGPKLAFGEPATDNVRLMLRCPPGGSSVILSFTRPAAQVAARPGEMVVAAGGSETRLPIESRDSALGGRIVEATADLDSAPLRRFGEGAALSVRWGEETIALPPAGEEARRFLDTCGRS